MKLVLANIAVLLVVIFVVVSADELPDNCRDRKYATRIGCALRNGFRFDETANKCLPVRRDCNFKQNFFLLEKACSDECHL